MQVSPHNMQNELKLIEMTMVHKIMCRMEDLIFITMLN